MQSCGIYMTCLFKNPTSLHGVTTQNTASDLNLHGRENITSPWRWRRNVSILTHYFTASQPWIPRRESWRSAPKVLINCTHMHEPWMYTMQNHECLSETDYWNVLKDFDSWGSTPDRGGIFFFDTRQRPYLGHTQPPIQWVSASPSPLVNQSRHVTDHSPPPSAKVKNALSYASNDPYFFMAW
jgi:hypothetical protein